jgi:hypothetical protein
MEIKDGGGGRASRGHSQAKPGNESKKNGSELLALAFGENHDLNFCHHFV